MLERLKRLYKKTTTLIDSPRILKDTDGMYLVKYKGYYYERDLDTWCTTDCVKERCRYSTLEDAREIRDKVVEKINYRIDEVVE